MRGQRSSATDAGHAARLRYAGVMPARAHARRLLQVAPGCSATHATWPAPVPVMGAAGRAMSSGARPAPYDAVIIGAGVIASRGHKTTPMHPPPLLIEGP